MLVYDIGLDIVGDLVLEGGDLLVREATAQHVNALLVAAPGDMRDAPLVGVDATRLVRDELPALREVLVDATVQLEDDGMVLERVALEGDALVVVGVYR